MNAKGDKYGMVNAHNKQLVPIECYYITVKSGLIIANYEVKRNQYDNDYHSKVFDMQGNKLFSTKDKSYSLTRAGCLKERTNTYSSTVYLMSRDGKILGETNE